MTPQELKNLIVNVLKDKKANDITVIDLGEKTIIADYFVIASGRSTTQVRSLAESLEDKLDELEIFASRKDGMAEARWVVCDYQSVIVHIFNTETRDFYCLEKLWGGSDNVTKIED